MTNDGIALAFKPPSHPSGWLARLVRQCWCTLAQLRARRPRRLRLCESLPLGERRFVAVVEFDRARFLVGGTPSSLVLLSRLEDEDPLENREAAKLSAEEER